MARDVRKAFYYSALPGPVIDVRSALADLLSERTTAVDVERLARLARLYRLPSLHRARVWALLLGSWPRPPLHARSLPPPTCSRQTDSRPAAPRSPHASGVLPVLPEATAGVVEEQRQEARDVGHAVELLYAPTDVAAPSARLLAMTLVRAGCARQYPRVRHVGQRAMSRAGVDPAHRSQTVG